jgi:hypothetical protein
LLTGNSRSFAAPGISANWQLQEIYMPRMSDDARRTPLELIQTGGAPVETVARLRAPDELTDEQREEWNRLIGAMPADWFSPGNVSGLVQLCRHVAMARQVAQLLEAEGSVEEDIDLVQFLALAKAQQAETKAIHQLMTGLRLTPQSFWPSRQAAKQVLRTQLPKPWDRRAPKR